MNLLSLKRTGGFASDDGSNKIHAADVKNALTSNSQLYSTEGAQLITGLKEGKFDLDLQAVAEQLKPSLESSNTTDKFQNKTGMLVASFVASFGQSPKDYLQLAISTESKAPQGTVFAHADGAEYEVAYSPESFDNQSLVDHLAISVGLNYKISRQSPAMEMIYRTVPLTPEQGGIDITVPSLYVQNTLRHDLSGGESDFGLRRVMDATIDHTVLNDNSTTLIPIYTDAGKDKFVAESVVAPFEFTSGRRTVTTSALALGKTINLFGLGQADTIQRVGQSDYTEALDRNIGVDSVFFAVGGTTIRWDTRGLPFSRFVKGPEQGGRSLLLNFPLTTLILGPDSVDYEGEELSGGVFDTINNGKYKVRLKTVLTGNADVERGTVTVSASQVEVMNIQNEAGALIPLTSGAGKAIVDGLANLNVVGWFPDARVTNSNHRHLGLMLNVRTVTERLQTRLRSPFFVPYPVNEDRDQTIMDYLTFAVGAYMNNEAVTTLINYHERLMRLTGGLRGQMTVGDYELNSLPIEGVGRYLVNPYVAEVNINLLNGQSLETTGNLENANAVLINAVRSIAFEILQNTNYENAARYMDGGDTANNWKIALVTSPAIKQFFSVSGDTRTLGANLPFQLESDPDARLRNTMYMTFIREGDGIDPLNAGVNLMTPTLVSTITTTRNNRVATECVVQPRFQHYNLLPIIVKFNVSGVFELLESVMPFRVQNQPVDAFEGSPVTGTTPGTGTTDPVTPPAGGDSGAGTTTP